MLYTKVYKDILKYLFSTNDFSQLSIGNGYPYPLDLGFTLEDESFYYHPQDKDGVPYRLYQSVGKQYNPTRIAAYALANFNCYALYNYDSCFEIFLKCADWFLGIEDARYEYHFDWSDLKAPWISSMAQGEAASVLIRAYKITGDEKYLKHAKLSLEPLFVRIGSGGVQSLLPDGSLFVEEYPSRNPTHVLNGFLYALIGLGEYAEITESKRHKDLFRQLSLSVCTNIDIWCHGRWSLYEDRIKAKGLNFCTPSYHNLQITQLKWLNARVNDPEIEKTINAWEKGLGNLWTRLFAFAGKAYFRLKNRAQR
ncbi:D-glucuronyl C5-epimerase family protein [Geoalkalibacter subterraneus]|uniref:D-glucuronyl C5-epimerase n=1 Tax=Geoalkalibacter subterraneus TaxID=483547 RepID=A0A0B5FHH4_9BACT|nr:D-glucuronyl C5-epimerase family protein [Geoalkalibacter subterraneus]AJF07642.1 D-glucuronyl C5-epimerase [Geoalkalibacter subterraneus]